MMIIIGIDLCKPHISQRWIQAAVPAELAASRMFTKYRDLIKSCVFRPIMVETFGSMESSAAAFFTDVDCKIGPA